MGRSSLVILSYPLAMSEVSVGRVITFPKQPSRDFFDASEQLPGHPTPSMIPKEVNNVSRLLRTSNSPGLELALTAFAQIFLKGEIRNARQLEAKVGMEYLLSNVNNWFKEICQSDLTRQHLELRAMDGDKSYLVTGLQTLTDADITLDKSKKLDLGGGVQAPLLSAAGIPIPTPLDPTIEMHHLVERARKDVTTFPGERIYGIQYQEIRIEKLLRTKDFSYKLGSKVWWEPMFEDRGGEDDDDQKDAEEVVEAELLQSITQPADLISTDTALEDGVDVYIAEADG